LPILTIVEVVCCDIWVWQVRVAVIPLIEWTIDEDVSLNNSPVLIWCGPVVPPFTS
jgi:hypothetical protein